MQKIHCEKGRREVLPLLISEPLLFCLSLISAKFASFCKQYWEEMEKTCKNWLSVRKCSFPYTIVFQKQYAGEMAYDSLGRKD